MDKEIRINKPRSDKVIEMDDLTKAKEFSSGELQGVVNLSLNQYIQDYVSLEIQHRVLKELLDLLRGKEKRDEVLAKMTEVAQRMDNITKQIRHHRQVRDELGDGRFTV